MSCLYLSCRGNACHAPFVAKHCWHMGSHARNDDGAVRYPAFWADYPRPSESLAHRNANNIAIVRLLVTQAAPSSVSIGFTSSIIRYDLGLRCTFRLSSTWVRFSRSSARCAARTGKSRSRRTVVSTSSCPVPIAVTSKVFLLAAQTHSQDHTLASQMDQLASMRDITDSICRILRQGAGAYVHYWDDVQIDRQDFFTTRAVVCTSSSPASLTTLISAGRRAHRTPARHTCRSRRVQVSLDAARRRRNKCDTVELHRRADEPCIQPVRRQCAQSGERGGD